jgi:hypothetical protein
VLSCLSASAWSAEEHQDSEDTEQSQPEKKHRPQQRVLDDACGERVWSSNHVRMRMSAERFLSDHELDDAFDAPDGQIRDDERCWCHVV